MSFEGEVVQPFALVHDPQYNNGTLSFLVQNEMVADWMGAKPRVEIIPALPYLRERGDCFKCLVDEPCVDQCLALTPNVAGSLQQIDEIVIGVGVDNASTRPAQREPVASTS